MKCPFVARGALRWWGPPDGCGFLWGLVHPLGKSCARLLTSPGERPTTGYHQPILGPKAKHKRLTSQPPHLSDKISPTPQNERRSSRTAGSEPIGRRCSGGIPLVACIAGRSLSSAGAGGGAATSGTFGASRGRGSGRGQVAPPQRYWRG